MRFDFEQAAAYVGLPVGTLQYYRSVDKGPRSYKIGRRVWFDRADLDLWLETERRRTERSASV
ncbi:helix-turn-helix domain-containing protein [Mycobacterium arosiense]|uniref:Helix-turn-helix domain-containing protein n=1 Tax=Mycobacterium arosiense ATCC BAA-1401 = DSM 45069 TaxID=1265311 RepID=A0A1W9ZKG9_MYCAI|nr:helix-turn-helix domain-containing protein [Mycobacterium arosiense]ORA17369.1 hypothetical protein BST14_08840 [Mycobacterium arosiense ATCC BAA-1401 = DSM 45069]